MKQTAVEWLIEEMLKQGYFDGNKPLTFTNLDHLQQQAKQMDKEQKIEAYLQGSFDDGPNVNKAEQYYNETYETKAIK
jgi:hypothetical protein